MTTAYKVGIQILKTMDAATNLLERVVEKHKQLEQLPRYELFDFEDKARHPYHELYELTDSCCGAFLHLTKGVSKWKIGASRVIDEIFSINEKQNLEESLKRAILNYSIVMDETQLTASKSSDAMIECFSDASKLWSLSSKKAIRDNIRKNINAPRATDYIENPEIDIERDCKRFIAEVKKLNKVVRDVKRGKETMMDCYKKKQALAGVSRTGALTVLDILMK